MSIYINVVYEDAISEFVILKILNSFNGKFTHNESFGGRGNGYIKKNLPGFNQASQTTPFLVLTDLDRIECPIILLKDWMKFDKHPNLIFRIAVREIESWLIADQKGFSKFLGISEINIDKNPDQLSDPKNTLVNLVKKSRKRTIKEDIIPINSNAMIGPNYNEQLINYVENYWSLSRAIINSESLKRTIKRLDNFKKE